MFLAVQPFSQEYVRGCIPKLFLERVTMKVVENSVEDVKYISRTRGTKFEACQLVITEQRGHYHEILVS
jgi:hypothetical protein